MTRRTFIVSMIASATVSTVTLLAQGNPPQPPTGNIDITGIPALRGIYYHAASGWESLSPRVLMPLWDGKPAAMEVLNVGSDHTITELPGRHSDVQIGDARPTFYLHGIDPTDLYLVRVMAKDGYRELRMPISRHFWEWAHYNAKDVTDVEIQGVNGDIIAIRPSANLAPGEYTLASVFGPDYRWLRLGFDFGIAGTR